MSSSSKPFMESQINIIPKPPRFNCLKRLGQPISPARAVCVRKTYIKYEPRTEHMPWGRVPSLRPHPRQILYTPDADDNGFIRGQKLQRSLLETMNHQHEDDFPKCQGVNRFWLDDEVYPQYGDLKSNMFKPCPPLMKTHLQLERRKCRAEVGEKKSKGIQDPQAEVENRSRVEERPGHAVDDGLAAPMRKHLQELEDQRKRERKARKARRAEDRQPIEEDPASSSHGRNGCIGVETKEAS